ncbi:MAG: DUF3078 domain-containing protein [Ignavibacteriaceae bacterium]|nr:DUF3078 domain-containing protein [Ignavibacteriaceae bacterium]
MRTILTLSLLALFTIVSFAQEEPEEKKDTLWTPRGVVGINLSQVAFDNWSQGGQNSLSFTFFSLLGLDYIGDPWKWRNGLKFAYGRTKVGDEEYRTNDNEIFFESTLIYHTGWAASPYAGVTARTAVTKGFDYSVVPSEQIVDFMDPFYLTEALGFIYDRIPNFSTRLGIGMKQTFTDKFNQYSDDPETLNELEKFKNETGIESVTEYKWEFLENMAYLTSLRLFGTFDDLSVWDVRWDNLIVAKVNDYISVSFNVLLIYDEDESIQRQLKEALQLGISYNLF